MPPGDSPLDAEGVTPFQPHIYPRFVAMAKSLLRRRRDHQDPGTLSLVDDVFAGLLRSERDGSLPRFESDDELLKYLSHCLRNHLVSLARHRIAARRPPEARRVEWPVSEMFPATRQTPTEILDVHAALEQLTTSNAQLAQVVELIFFGGCSQQEVANATGRTLHQVRADWEFARGWLKRRLRS